MGNNTMHKDLISFLRENELKGMRLRIFLFWARHPHAKFNLEGIAHMLDLTRHNLREILRDLIDEGIVNEQYLANGIAHYSLNREHALGQYIPHLLELDWSTIKSLEGEVERELVLA
jgi:hypothetical protein